MDSQDGLVLKQGDIKVNTCDLGRVIMFANNCQSIIGNNFDILSEEEKSMFLQEIDFYRTFIEKYVVSSDLRRREHLWFSLVRVVDEETFVKVEEKDVANKEELDFYMDFLKGEVAREQTVSDGMKMLIGIAVTAHGKAVVRRCLWGMYIEAKTARENAARLAERA